jgi:hypothetical protein
MIMFCVYKEGVNEKYKRIHARVNYKQIVEIDSAASSGGQNKYMWSPLEAALSVLNVIPFLLFNA